MELQTTTQKLQPAPAKEHEVASEEMSSSPALEEGLSSSEFVPPWLKEATKPWSHETNTASQKLPFMGFSAYDRMLVKLRE